MQLSRARSIRHAVTAVTTALLGSSLAAAPSPNNVESSLLIYSETNRVSAAEGVVDYSKLLKRGYTFNGSFTFDALTGASPNGAAPARSVQTFTRASGGGGYVAQPGEFPLDNTFHDTRYAFSGTFSKPLNRNTNGQFGGHLSIEHDYYSLGINGGLSRDFNRRNTTISLSASYSHDIVAPKGGIPIPFASMPMASSGGGGDDRGGDDREGPSLPSLGSSDNKNVYDVVLGLTQVLDRETLARINYSFNYTSGYLTDPFKVISLVNGPESPDAGEPLDYLYEHRPSSRTSHAVYGQILRYLGGNTINLSYRYFWDDWHVRSNTVDFFYRQQIGAGQSVQPHFRRYRQSAADFYRHFLVNGVFVPPYASADARLDAFDAYTVGLQYSVPAGNDSHVTFTGEYYTQRGDSSPPEAFGTLRGLNLFPKMNAFMFRVGFSHDF